MLALLIFWKQVYSKVYNKQTIWYLPRRKLVGPILCKVWAFLKQCQCLLFPNCLGRKNPISSPSTDLFCGALRKALVSKGWVWFSGSGGIYQLGHHSFLASAIAGVSENRRANQTRKKKWITGSSRRITIQRLRSRLSRYQKSQISLRFWWRRKESRCCRYETRSCWFWDSSGTKRWW